MVEPDGVAQVVKTVRQFRTQPEVAIDLGQQHRAGIAGESAAGEIGLHFAGSQVIEKKGLISCEHAASLWTRYGKSSEIFIKSAGHSSHGSDAQTLCLFYDSPGRRHRVAAG